jgi:hypothetical protein
MQGLYAIDKNAEVRTAHANAAVAELYAEFLGAPLSETSHHLLHTAYTARETVR